MALRQAQTKNPKFVYYIFKGNTVEQVIDYITVRNAKSALVVDDLGLQIINRLLQEGVTDITLCLTRFPKDLMPAVKYIIFNSFPSIKINIIHYEEISMIQNVDLIISNPAYGKIGADITYKIKDQVTYREFINLLPANDYKRNSDKNLFNFQSDMVPVPAGFEDADVTTHLARIHKTKVNDMTLDEFEVTQYTDTSLIKYFTQNISRPNKFFADYDSTGSRLETWQTDTVFVNSTRTTSDGHFARTKTSPEYRWNILNEYSDLKSKGYDALENKQGRHKTSFVGVFLSSPQVKQNVASFIYSSLGYRFMEKVLSAMAKDSWAAYTYWMPKVDWTRTWTVEEILADYGYTETEIAEVITDLNSLNSDGKPKYKGMED
jgi:hypothetical protein